VWAGRGRSEAALGVFFGELGEQRAAQSPMLQLTWLTGSPRPLRLVHRTQSDAQNRPTLWQGQSKRSTLTGAAPGTKPKAARSHHPLAERDAPPGDSRQIARSRYAPWKNPDDLNTRQHQQLDWIARTDPKLWRAYLLKEGHRYVFAVKGQDGKDALDRWLSCARCSQLESFIQLAERITKHRDAIEANLEQDLSQGLIESTNTKIRLLTRIAFGFHGPEPLIALGSHPPQLPGRT
jgi:transposase